MKIPRRSLEERHEQIDIMLEALRLKITELKALARDAADIRDEKMHAKARRASSSTRGSTQPRL
jgi:hypothetical protein